MSSHIRIRPTALIIEDNQILFIEYSESQNELHYNLPGGGVEAGESITETLERELWEEANIQINIGPIAFLYEYNPLNQSGEYESNTPVLNIIFECSIKPGSEAKLPDNPDPMQIGVRWISLESLEQIILYPNIKSHIIEYTKNRRTIELIEDHQLEKYSKNI
ncbi:NUDIX domain-containing protein [Paenibacillaceae bacterium]|nr:NUDIX domain-containing protein [Paenibacillaceae bacterium]